MSFRFSPALSLKESARLGPNAKITFHDRDGTQGRDGCLAADKFEQSFPYIKRLTTFDFELPEGLVITNQIRKSGWDRHPWIEIQVSKQKHKLKSYQAWWDIEPGLYTITADSVEFL